ncbi:Pectinesterase inhibitor domain containing protein [Parasponia andersonii]|uniref:Pectinesterase inhibitor domain containing protein n=1 Tax=Parasponia andersonii TaxID=3476 RepID=A0A2P5CXT6_PARAD|nr:Pectinesterase inhibitor domain containing protein [Parasponia andersonii]
MEYYVNTFFLLFLVTIFLSYSPKHTVAHQDNKNQTITALLSTACKHAEHKDFCVSMLVSDPNIHDADLKGLGLIALRQASSNASDISEYVKTLLNDSSLDPAVQDGVSECLEHYLDAAEQLDDSVAALLADAHKDVDAWIGVALTDSISCDAALSEGHESVLGGKNEVFRQLCDNALAINKVLSDNKN